MVRVLITLYATVFSCALTVTAQTTRLSGSHTEVPRWCGKAYMQGSPNFDPGGQLYPPKPSTSLLLDIRIAPRYSIYESSETAGTFLVDAELSSSHGKPYTNESSRSAFTSLKFDVREKTTGLLLASSSVAINTTDNLISFDLSKVKPRLKPYQITLNGSSSHSHSNQSFTATTELYYLPAKRTGSTVKIDNLHGGMLVANHATKYAFSPLLPFGFYASCSDYLNTTLANVTNYAHQGFNAVNPVCAFSDGNLTDMFNWLDQTGIWYQYDMRGTYQNISSIKSQIPLVKDRDNLLMWYTADEPDGWSYPLDSTKRAYDVLREQDPYHPTALVMNCRDYYFREYSTGADVIMEDVYPVGINTTYSRRWHTPVNETFGDAGCDDCKGELTDVSDRFDEYARFQHWVGGDARRKPLWAVLQAFSGGDYWSRDPTAEETWVMALLAFNHGAKGVLSWLFPPSSALVAAHSKLAKVITKKSVSSFLLGGDPIEISTSKTSSIDVAYWALEDKILLSLANYDVHDSKKVLEIKVPVPVSRIASHEWGSIRWSLTNNTLNTNGDKGLATSLVVLDRVGVSKSELRAL